VIHARWLNDIKETQGHAGDYPLIGDADLTVGEAVRHDPPDRRQ